MTALPEPWRLLTVADYEALEQDELNRWELQEGKLAMAPSPTLDHNMAAGELLFQMRTQLPSRLAAALDMDVDLQLVPGDQPATVRKPDLIVIERHERDRLRGKRGIVRAESVRLVVEIVSPGSRRMDYVIKRAEYADAGIPHYWIIDPSSPISVLALRLTDELGYVEEFEGSGAFSVASPAPMKIDLDRLAD
ncbi:Uma2 family endonuclease [Nocardia puris]|uniref:Uma2 family endonuclease n=1 Tax=Nocardia puris TaxID=208602 RepID=A0A366DL78_9NOCA|nr:Uma2 family endonuclease [Nocardia puris]MBF6211471.1 Uma2 family endonuclease [Nocardia puris]RBO90832.1 Uma2 family endonuclease [Nocardia puris]